MLDLASVPLPVGRAPAPAPIVPPMAPPSVPIAPLAPADEAGEETTEGRYIKKKKRKKKKNKDEGRNSLYYEVKLKDFIYSLVLPFFVSTLLHVQGNACFRFACHVCPLLVCLS